MSVSSTWAQLTTSLAVLEDSSLAIDYYIDSEYPEELTGKYLYTYSWLSSMARNRRGPTNLGLKP